MKVKGYNKKINTESGCLKNITLHLRSEQCLAE